MQNKDNDKELKEILKKIEILDDLLESVKREDKEKRKQEEQLDLFNGSMAIDSYIKYFLYQTIA